MTNDAEAAARALAHWLAPYLAESSASPHPQPQPSLLESYDEGTCAVFVSSLGDVVLDNAEVFFTRLAHDGESRLTRARGRDRRRQPPKHPRRPHHATQKASQGALATAPLGQDAHGQRTVWLNREGIAERMLRAVHEEKARRARRRAA